MIGTRRVEGADARFQCSSERMAGPRLSSGFDLARWFAEETVWWYK
jgi:hypothetical protein